MSHRLIIYMNTLLGIVILATLIFAFPYFVSAFFTALGNRHLEAATEELPPRQDELRQAVSYLQQAIRWDKNNEGARQSLDKAYRALAEVYLGKGKLSEARAALEYLLASDPDDAFTLYHLAEIHEARGERAEAIEKYQRLRYFQMPIEGKVPPYIASLAQKLEEYRVWDIENILTLSSLLLWRGELEQAEQLINYMIAKYPDRADWYYQQGQLYRRRGEIQKAVISFKRAIELNPHHAEAYFELARISHWAGNLDEALSYYEGCLRAVPDHLLALRSLTQLYREQGKAKAEALRKRLEKSTSNHEIVAEMLGLKEGDFELGDNLLANGGFETGDLHPANWEWATWIGSGIWKEALYIGGLDKSESYEGNQAVRVTGLWIRDAAGREAARAGYWAQAVKLKPRTPYLLSFYYKTQNLRKGQAALWLGKSPHVLFAGDYMLPDTNGSWRKFMILGWNKGDEPAEIRPLLRNWGVGDVWFDGVMLQEVILGPQAQVADMTTRFEVR